MAAVADQLGFTLRVRLRSFGSAQACADLQSRLSLTVGQSCVFDDHAGKLAKKISAVALSQRRFEAADQSWSVERLG
jgi:hypothetical protein